MPSPPANRPPEELAKRITLNFPFQSGDVAYIADGDYQQLLVSFPFEIVDFTLTADKNVPSDFTVKLMACVDRAAWDPATVVEITTLATRPTITAPALVSFGAAPAAWTRRFRSHVLLRAVAVGNTSTLRGATLGLGCERR